MLEFLSEQAPPVLLFSILMAFYAFGDFLTKKSKALIPSIFIMVLLMAAGSWAGIIPSNIVARIGFTAMGPVASSIIVVNMGTSLHIKDITSNWRIAVIGLVALVGVAIGCLTMGYLFFGWENAVVATPVVGGGIVAMLEMQNAANELFGTSDPARAEILASLAALILSVQSLPAFVLIPPIIKRAMKKDLETVSETEMKEVSSKVTGKAEEAPTFLPSQYWSTATILLALGIVGTVAIYLNQWFRTFMGQYALATSVIALIISIILTEFRVLPRNANAKAGVGGLIFLIVIFNAFASVLAIDFHQFVSLIGPIAGLIFFGIIGILVFTYVVGRFVFKMDGGYAFVLGLNCLLGFPLNFILTTETIEGLAGDDEEAKAYLTGKYVPQMLVAGFVTITIGSVILAGIMRGFL